MVSDAKYKSIQIKLTPKQTLQRLPMAFADNISANLLNEIKQIICSLYRAKETNKKV